MPTFKVDYYQGSDKQSLEGQTGDRVISLVAALVDDPEVRALMIFKEKKD